MSQSSLSVQISRVLGVRKLAALAAAVCALLAPSALGQIGPPTDPCEPFGSETSECGEADPLSEVDGGENPHSKCFHLLPVNCGQAPSSFGGFPLNLHLWYGVAPGDYPPRSLDMARDSGPIVTREGAEIMGPSGRATRPALADTVDLLTGAPLLQDIDLELPFGSAQYRHVRTYSEISSLTRHENDCYETTLSIPLEGTLVNAEAADLYWDWQGQGWMMGEAPILLIDAAYWGTAHPYTNRRCYFVADAHHAIPFEQLQDSGEYVAPPRFDAYLVSEGGTWVPPDGDVPGHWAVLPSQFYVYLHNQSLKYTILPRYEDVGTTSDNESAHRASSTRAFNTGAGVPYYGLVKSIEDRDGNQVNIEYCPFRADPCDNEATEGCIECCQSCHQKGQIRRVTLVADGIVEWTLLFVYRDFQPDWAYDQRPYGHHQQQAVHTIYAYKRALDQEELEQIPLCLSLPYSVFETAAGNDAPDDAEDIYERLRAIDSIDPATDLLIQNIPLDWHYKVSYMYIDNSHAFTGTALTKHLFGEYCEGPTESPRLIKASTQRNLQPDISQIHAVLDQSHYLYRYESLGGYTTGRTRYDGTSLKAAWGPRAIEGIRSGNDANPTTTIGDRMARWPVGLLTLQDTDDVPVWRDDASGGDEIPMLTSAEQVFSHWDTPDRATDYGVRAEYLASSFLAEMADEHIKVDQARLVSLRDSVFVYSDRRDSSVGRHHKVYRFAYVPANAAPANQGTIVPNDATWGEGDAAFKLPFRAVIRDPYCYYKDGDFNLTDPAPVLNLGEPFWITVIDEYGTADECEFDYLTEGQTVAVTDALTRRMVQVNAAGHILKERIWDVKSGNMVYDEGLAEEFEYDDRGRLTEKRSFGWCSYANQHPDPWPEGDSLTEGLIYVYAYNDDPGNEKYPTEVGAVGVQQGKPAEGQGNVRWIKQYVRNAVRPDLIDQEIQFTGLVQTLDWTEPDYGAAAQVTRYLYDFEPVEDPDAPVGFTMRLAEKRVIQPAAPREPGGTAYHAVGVEIYNDKGHLEWKGYGSVVDDEGLPATGDEFYLDYTAYDEQGRPIAEVVDASEEAELGEGNAWEQVDVPVYPEGFARFAPDGSDALDAATYREYAWYGVQHQKFPNGRFQYTLIHSSQIGDLEQRVFKDMVRGGGGVFTTESAGEFSFFQNGQLQYSQEARWTQELSTNPSEILEFDALATLNATYDAGGRMTKLGISGPDGASAEAAVQYDYIGEIKRERNAAGTITRTVNDPLGRVDRIFRGTKDHHTFWGQNEPNDDNMVLLERRVYSDGKTQNTGRNDARQLIEVHSFRGNSADQYENNEPTSWSERHRYDWRMRDVWNTRFDDSQTPVALSHTVRFYDNLDRLRYSAVYGPDDPPNIGDPTQLDIDDPLPDVIDILEASPAPLRFSETVYDARGRVAEQREYNLEDSADFGTYTATQTCYDHAGRPVYTRSSGSGITLSEYDAVGRQRVTRTIAAGVEVSRTETIFDPDGNAAEIHTWTRTHDGTGEELDNGNSVRTIVYNWYDVKNRVVATAEIGTGSGDGADTFVSAGEPPVRTDPVPKPTYDEYGAFTGIEREDVPDWAKLTCFEYDDSGRRTGVFHPDGSVTRYVYDSLGALLLTNENAAADLRIEMRQTANVYEDGRLTKIVAVLPGHNVTSSEGPLTYSQISFNATDGTLQVTELEYGAQVIWDGNDPEHPSLNNDWVGKVYLPDPTTGQPSETAAFTFTYYPDGFLHSRTDAAGHVFEHTYDESGRLAQTDVTYPTYPSEFGTAPKDRIKKLVYTYDALGQLTKVTARTTNDDYVSENEFVYDNRGNLLKEKQQHGAAVGLNTPVIDYTWLYSPHDELNSDRLATMTYPARPDGSQARRTLSFECGGTDSIDEALARVTHVEDSVLGVLAEYAYTGDGRLVARALGGELGSQSFAVSQTYSDGVATGYTKLDTFGRVKDLDYIDSSGNSLRRDTHGYDAMDRRRWDLVTQRDSSQNEQENERSSLYSYDGLGRLTETDVGELLFDQNGVPSIDHSTLLPIKRETDWLMDNLGSWAGENQGGQRGRVITGQLDPDPAADTHWYGQNIDARNRIESVDFNDGSGTTNTARVFDAAGNLRADADYLYEYDAFNRLVQVRARGSLTFDSDGEPTGGAAGNWLAHFTYDGLGRLIRKQTPHPSPGGTDTHTERFYFDGVRRVLEEFTDPLPTTGGGIPIQTQVGNPPPPQTVTWTEREHVYAPPGAGTVDEWICQIDNPNNVYYTLQNVNTNVTAIVRLHASAWKVAAQYWLDPYGDPLAIDLYNSFPATFNRVGHQGLFADRLDVTGTSAQLAVAGRTLYQNGNRTYTPALGRFLQPDPHRTAQHVLHRAAVHGTTIGTLTLLLDAQGRYANGMSLYTYLGSNPLTRSDPSGLEWDPFDMVDDFLAEDAGSKAAFMENISAGFDTTLHIGLAIAQLYPPIGLAVSAYNIATGQGSVWDAVSALGPAKVVAKTLFAYNKTRKAYEAANRTRILAARLKANRLAGDAAEEALRAMFGGVRKYFPMPPTFKGGRHVDSFVDGMAMECKVGRVALEGDIATQVAKDSWLLSSGKVTGVQWHFFESSVTGAGGPTAPLREALEKAGIEIIEHF